MSPETPKAPPAPRNQNRPALPAVPPGSPATQHQLARLMQKVSKAFLDAGVKLEPPAPRK